MSAYSIRDLENLSGIKAHTIRIWEQRYSIVKPSRSDTNIRTYDDEDLKRILNISVLKDKGFKISKIAGLSSDELCDKVFSLSEENLQYPDQIHNLTVAMIDMDEERFEKIISQCILQYNFENTMINIIYPFLSRIGTLWMTGSIGPAQEHFITHLIRQKMIVAIDGQIVRPNEHSKKFVLYLPEGEMHEVGLLFANYILRARNHRVFYLGQSLPFDDLSYVYENHQPDYLFSSITSVPGPDAIKVYIEKLGNKFPDVKILLTGYQVVGHLYKIPANVQIISNVNQLIEIAE